MPHYAAHVVDPTLFLSIVALTTLFVILTLAGVGATALLAAGYGSALGVAIGRALIATRVDNGLHSLA